MTGGEPVQVSCFPLNHFFWLAESVPADQLILQSGFGLGHCSGLQSFRSLRSSFILLFGLRLSHTCILASGLVVVNSLLRKSFLFFSDLHPPLIDSVQWFSINPAKIGRNLVAVLHIPAAAPEYAGGSPHESG